MSRLTDLLNQLRKENPQLGADLEAEINALAKRRTFGLVFERHQPEAVELPELSVKKGSKVRILPPRGSTKTGDKRLWLVESIAGSDGERRAALVEMYAEEPEITDALVADLVVVAEFKDGIYPGLVETGRVERGGDKPFHTVINAENFHALEMLTYTHRGKIDAIYIDPPYNTGAKNWKYNNDYVEGDDAYRHSKWLAMMERRLLIAKELLNPDDSVLICAIDEKEYLRLGLLLEQSFPEARIQMVSSVINPAGASRSNEFFRTDEYIFIVQLGSSSPSVLPLSKEWMGAIRSSVKGKLHWNALIRTGSNSLRTDRPNLFYPIFIRNTDRGPIFHSVGAPYYGSDPDEVLAPEGTVAVWPMKRDGREANWQLSSDTLPAHITSGYVRIGQWRGSDTSFSYLKRGEVRKVEDGIFPVVGHNPDGSVRVDEEGYTARFVPGTAWQIPSHDASRHGSNMLNALIPRHQFPFPKSLYAVEDVLRFFVKDTPNAVILDFFAGSGTTAHAVMRLNKQDGGHRQCISVTNNEVAASEQAKLRKQGLRPGDPKWELLGICDYITKQRIRAAISGKTPDGTPIKGDYKFTDDFPMADGFEENAAFFTLTYESPLSVRHHRAFERIAPMLWLRAGSRGRIITSLGDQGWDVAEAYGVLEDFNHSSEFLAQVAATDSLGMLFLITDDHSAFQMVCRDLPERLVPVRLYSSYLENFEINRGRA